MAGSNSATRTRINASTSTSTDLIEAELSNANARLSRLQNQQRRRRAEDVGSSLSDTRRPDSDDNYQRMKRSVDGNGDKNSAAVALIRRAQELRGQIELLDLNRGVVKFVSDAIAKSSNDLVRERGDGCAKNITLLSNATETCTALGFLILQHNRQYSEELYGNSEGRHPYYTALVNWYDSLHECTREFASSIFRKQLAQHSPEYPFNQRSSAVISEALSSSSSSPASCYYEWNSVSGCFVELQVIHDVLNIEQQKQERPPSCRLDIVDELCKPLAERLRFHFLDEKSSGIMSCAAPTINGTNQSERGNCDASKLDRLPEWLFRYLREVVENHDVLSLVISGVQQLVNSVIDSIMVRASQGFSGHDNEKHISAFGIEGYENKTTAAISGGSSKIDELFQNLKCHKYDHVSTYFLREVARMARHAIRAKSFFHHPDVVGSECRDRTIVLRGIEQLFVFDSFIDERCKYDECDDYNDLFLPPRMVDTFLLSDESLFQWWLEEERDGMSSLLRECASSTLLSQYEESGVGGEGGAHFPNGIELRTAVAANTPDGSADRQHRFYPQVSELFVALLHAARCKIHIIGHEQYKQIYMANIIAPLCSELLDFIHAEASWLRKRLLARPPPASSTAVSSVRVLRSSNLPSDALLTWNTMEWASLIAGTNLAAQALLLHQSISKRDHHHNDLLDRVGESMKHLCTAMVEEFTSAFVETILMERAKLASYVMRSPFLLSHHPPDLDSPGRRLKRDKDTSIRNVNFALSPDLNDSIHAMSVVVQACNQLMLKLKTMLPSCEPCLNQPSNALYRGCSSIHEALKAAIGQKFLDIAIDPQGMTPEVRIGGAMQFQHDVMAFNRLFRVGSDGCEVGNIVPAIAIAEPGPMERAESASRLMSLDSSHIRAIREALRALAVPSSATESLVGRVAVSNERLDIDDFYSDERLMDEAVSMLEAKKFGALSLDEALSILNRRY